VFILLDMSIAFDLIAEIRETCYLGLFWTAFRSGRLDRTIETLWNAPFVIGRIFFLVPSRGLSLRGGVVVT
jgi:hypothetical protein